MPLSTRLSPTLSPRHSRHYWDVWPDKVMRERFVHDWDDWRDFADNSLTSRNRRSELERRPDSKNEVTEDTAKGFQVKLDVSHFRPREVEIKYMDGNIVVTGKHEEVEDKQGWVSRQFTRRYVLPEEYDEDVLNATITSDGVLVIKAPVKRIKRVASNERMVPITHTNHISIRNGSK